MDNNNSIIMPTIKYENIKNMIYEIRGEKVMLDFELASIYGYSTKTFNQQVKNNIARFEDSFRFQLTKDELNIIISSKNDSKSIWASNRGGRTSLPYAFTEEGLYMLIAVLKGDLAVKQSIALVKAFRFFKDYYYTKNNLIPSSYNKMYLDEKFSSYDNRFDNIESMMKSLMGDMTDTTTYKHFFITNGQKIEADNIYQKIYQRAKKTIYILDDYIDIKTLLLLKACNSHVDITIFTDNKGKNGLNLSFLNDFIYDTGLSISLKKNNKAFHDRYIILDYGTKNEEFFHCGASSKDAGNCATTIIKIDDSNVYHSFVEELLQHDNIEL